MVSLLSGQEGLVQWLPMPAFGVVGGDRESGGEGLVGVGVLNVRAHGISSHHRWIQVRRLGEGHGREHARDAGRGRAGRLGHACTCSPPPPAPPRTHACAVAPGLSKPISPLHFAALHVQRSSAASIGTASCQATRSGLTCNDRLTYRLHSVHLQQHALLPRSCAHANHPAPHTLFTTIDGYQAGVADGCRWRGWCGCGQ